LSDNCGVATPVISKSLFTLRDTVTYSTPVTVGVTDLAGNGVQCSSTVVPILYGTLITNTPASLLNIPFGRSFIIRWATTATSFGSGDTVTIYLQSSLGVNISTVATNIPYLNGQYTHTFTSAGLSTVKTYRLKLFLNTSINGGFATVKFVNA